MPDPVAPRPRWRPVAAAALVVALLDFSYVFVLWVLVRQRISTMQLLQSIATGLLGRSAFDGGWPAAALGGVLHLTVALSWAVVFDLALRTAPALASAVSSRRGRIVTGCGYGVFVWWCMDLVVLPLSRARPTPVLSSTFAINTVQHALMVGLPMALIIGGAFARPTARRA